MKRLPFVQVYSEYHAIIVPMVLALLLTIDTTFRSRVASWMVSGDPRTPMLIVFVSVALAYAFWTGVRTGEHTERTKWGCAYGLFFVQLFFGGILGYQGVMSGDLVSMVFGGTMLALAAYRGIAFRFDLIDLTHYFADIDLRRFGMAISFALGTLIIVLTYPFGLSGLETASIAYLVADALTETRKDELFNSRDV